MKIRAAAAAFVFALAAGVLSADVVTDWNEAALDAIQVDRTAPPRASRNLAILHVAIYDAVNGIRQTHEPYFVTGKPAGVASVEAAASAAASKVLAELFPAQLASFEALHTSIVEGIADGPSRRAGMRWGESVADAILLFRSSDGSSTVVPYTPQSGAGFWQPTPPAFAAAVLPQWPHVTPFGMTSGAQFRPDPPPALDSQDWADEYNEVKELGSATSATRSAEQTDIARFWADGAGTVTPPGHWNVIAQDVAAQRGTTLEENARLFALLNIAQADAAIVSWDCKYMFSLWRPITAIRNGDTDPREDTEKVADWTPLLATPPFPEYTSGHSTFSGAASVILAEFFGSDAIAFTTQSEDLPGVTRSFSSFSGAAQEAALSRLYGGIHFRSGNEAGYSSGRALGAYVAANFLGDRPGKRERGR